MRGNRFIVPISKGDFYGFSRYLFMAEKGGKVKEAEIAEFRDWEAQDLRVKLCGERDSLAKEIFIFSQKIHK